MISSSQRPLPDNTQHSQQTNIHAPGGIRTHDLNKRAAADLRLRPRGHWDRRNLHLLLKITSQQPHPRLYVSNFNNREAIKSSYTHFVPDFSVQNISLLQCSGNLHLLSCIQVCILEIWDTEHCRVLRTAHCSLTTALKAFN